MAMRMGGDVDRPRRDTALCPVTTDCFWSVDIKTSALLDVPAQSKGGFRSLPGSKIAFASA